MDGKDFIVISKEAYEHGELFLDKNKTQLVLQQPGIEIAFEFLSKGFAGFFYVPENGNVTEISYIVEGKLEIYDQGKIIILNNGDFFYQQGPARCIPFEAYADTKLFYINNSPYFDTYEEDVSEMLNMLKQLQKVDGDTLNHCNRVKILCLGIARYIGFDQNKVNILCRAAQFHDVGKAKIPLDIILKPDRLTYDEFEIMKLHSKYTFEMIYEYYGEEIAFAAYNHHERLDGKGYPRHLHGDEIGLVSRIICVADAYDAIVTTRPYHIAKTQEDAIAELWSCVDVQFDASVIKALSDYLNSRKQYI